jgi:predicted permease
MLGVFLQILPLFLIIGLGWIIAKLGLANKYWLKPIGDFSFYIGFPALIFYNLIELHIPFDLIKDAFLHNTILIFSLVIILYISSLFLNISRRNKATLLFCFMFGNIAFMGIPILTSLDPTLKQEASLNAAIHLFWVFSIGIFTIEWLTSKQSDTKTLVLSLFKNPLLLAVLLGMFANVFAISLPEPITTPIKMLGNVVAPLVMLMIGIFMYINPINNWKELKNPFIYSSIKLLLFPIIATYALKSIELNDSFFSAVIDIAMPCAITPFALAGTYGLNKKFIANSIIVSTTLSILTLTIVIGLIS